LFEAMKEPFSLYFLWILLLCPAAVVVLVNAKTITGQFQLSKQNPDQILGAFCISARKWGHFKLQLSSMVSSSSILPQDHLTVRLYRDTDWANFDSNEYSCAEKSDVSIQNEPVNRQITELTMAIPNNKEHRAHYYYVAVTACSLTEIFADDSKVFELEYSLELKNNGSHVSADELHLNLVHMVTVLFSGSVAMLLALLALIQFYEKHTVHAAVLWVMAAAASDSLASLLAIIHLELYSHDGIGSALLDSLSCHLEATCDALVALLLLSIAAGWTLPSDVVNLRASDHPLQKVLKGLQSPFRSLQTLSSTSILAAFIFLSHILLAQWGLNIHNNEFSSYHDLENLPGRILMILRVLLGVMLWICCLNTKQQCPLSLKSFYNQLAVVGTIWFQSLPVLTWMVNTFQSYHLRHQTIGIWGASLQMMSIALLSWLVTAHSTTYHKVSHITTDDDSLTEKMAASARSGEGLRTWTIWGVIQAKIRLD